MLQINLLPKKYQDELRSHRVKSALIETSIFVILIFGVIVVGIILLTAFLGLSNRNLDTQIKTETAKLDEFAEFEQELSDYQDNAKLYDQTVAKQFDWSKTLDRLAKLTPTNLQILKLSILSENTEQRVIDVSGKAQDRIEVVKFIKSLNDSSAFEVTEYPGSDLDSDGLADFKLSIVLSE
jgi:Tfp pilus assembly protein PilN